MQYSKGPKIVAINRITRLGGNGKLQVSDGLWQAAHSVIPQEGLPQLPNLVKSPRYTLWNGIPFFTEHIVGDLLLP